MSAEALPSDTNRVTNTSSPDLVIRGGASIRHYRILNDKRTVLTKDTENNVAVYDVLKACKISDLGQVDLDEEIKRRNKTVYVPNWFNVDLKTGVSVVAFDFVIVMMVLLNFHELCLDANNSSCSR